ncbi:MAG: LamG domain-containing protein [Planctomycetes bacterium]|jgi:hypothetical protein|nr:LamG domain-containing protein [Planctomycetota bacterium]
MKTQRTTRGWLSVALCTLALGSPAWAGGGFRDDFRDGSIQDGSPVTWANSNRNNPGYLGSSLVTAEGLEFTPDWPANKDYGMYRGVVDAYGRFVHYTGNLTIRTQVKIGATTAHGSSVTLWFRGRSDHGNHGYLLGINNMFLWFDRSDGLTGYSPMDTWHYPMNGSFDPKKEFILQVDVIDLTDGAGHRTTSRLEARWWVVGQEMPVQPQLAVHDATYEVGEIAIGATCDSELNRTTIFRWVEVIGTEVEPIVDFNGNGTVDTDDLLRLIESWGQADPVVDLVPDGVVDRKDLEVMMKYWQQDVTDPSLLAHWALDETEGAIASDRTGVYDAALVGSPAWDPEGGRIGGALQLDGLDDRAVTPFVVNPAERPFSVLAWVKGGAPGQVIVAEQKSANWLRLDAAGRLLTEFKPSRGAPLASPVSLTDGQWHRIGLTWDGSHRTLFVDGIAVAGDAKVLGNPPVSTAGLYLGAGSTLTPGTFWSGRIDDVRIYNRVLKP